jgi:hypothetical protein
VCEITPHSRRRPSSVASEIGLAPRLNPIGCGAKAARSQIDPSRAELRNFTDYLSPGAYQSPGSRQINHFYARSQGRRAGTSRNN